MTTAPPVVHPVAAPRERLDHLDALRGFALCGILCLHCVALGGMAGLFGLGAPDVRPTDWAVYAGLLWLVESKFFSLFSLLFGVGFALQWPAVPRPGGGRRYLRRLLALAGFGAAHVLLLWDGDILLSYAVVGGLLVFFRRCRPRTLVRWAVGLLVVPLAGWILLAGGLELARLVPEVAKQIEKGDRKLLEGIAREEPGPDPTYLAVMRHRLEEYPAVLVLLASRVPTVLAMFLLGLAAERAGLAADPRAHRRVIRRLAGRGLGLGLLLGGLVTAALMTRPPLSALLSLFFNQAVAGPVLAIGYAAGGTLVLVSRPLPPLAAYGRMALTNYISHSVILYLLFSPDAAALKGRASPLALVGLAVAINLVLMGTSTLWLRRFRFGPLEWLWRTITYARLQPLLRRTLDGPRPTGDDGRS